jgi:hypothetical protein
MKSKCIRTSLAPMFFAAMVVFLPVIKSAADSTAEAFTWKYRDAIPGSGTNSLLYIDNLGNTQYAL